MRLHRLPHEIEELTFGQLEMLMKAQSRKDAETHLMFLNCIALGAGSVVSKDGAKAAEKFGERLKKQLEAK